MLNVKKFENGAQSTAAESNRRERWSADFGELGPDQIDDMISSLQELRNAAPVAFGSQLPNS